MILKRIIIIIFFLFVKETSTIWTHKSTLVFKPRIHSMKTWQGSCKHVNLSSFGTLWHRRSKKTSLQNFRAEMLFWLKLKWGALPIYQQIGNSRETSYIKEKPARVLYNIFDAAQEKHSLPPINQPMIVCQCNIHHWPRNNITSNDHWTAHYWVHA